MAKNLRALAFEIQLEGKAPDWAVGIPVHCRAVEDGFYRSLSTQTILRFYERGRESSFHQPLWRGSSAVPGKEKNEPATLAMP